MLALLSSETTSMYLTIGVMFLMFSGKKGSNYLLEIWFVEAANYLLDLSLLDVYCVGYSDANSYSKDSIVTPIVKSKSLSVANRLNFKFNEL